MTTLRGFLLAIGPLAIFATGTDVVTDRAVVVNKAQVCTVDVGEKEFTILCDGEKDTYPLKAAKRQTGVSRIKIREARAYSCKPAYKVGGITGIKIPFTDARECRAIA
jgi:hypothetical protein